MTSHTDPASSDELEGEEWEWESEEDGEGWEEDEQAAAEDEGAGDEGYWEEEDEDGWDWEEDWQEAEEPTRAGKGRSKSKAKSSKAKTPKAAAKSKASKASAKKRASKPKKKAPKSKAAEPEELPLDRLQDPLGLGLGLLASLPWIAAYEFSVASLADGRRNSGELLLSTPLVPLGDYESPARWIALALAVGCVLWLARSAPRSLFPRCLRVAGEGLLAAAVLGPLLLLLSDSLGVPVPGLNDGRDGHVPGLAVVARYSGGAFYEELLFRVMLPSAVFVTALQGARFLGLPDRGARGWATGVAWVGASVLFAASHLDGSLTWRGFGGEDWDPALFAWRALAGGLLLLILRLRGLGVAVWAHALFNAALVLGAGPAVFAA
ncbi:MAG: CPBP family glutamic-type intramembrane protease [Planctomycetota bacterium]|jgi:hypothetical protein